MSETLTNTNILVVGASSGIGRETARQLVDRGASVYVWSRRDNGYPEGTIASASVDVLDTVDTAAETLPEALHGLVYAPGSIPLGAFGRTDLNEYRSAFEINVVAAVRVLQAVQSRLIAAEGASVVLFSTVAVQRGMQFHSAVSSAKGGVEGLVRSYAAEFASKRIRCNAVAPSLTDTPLAARLLSNEKKVEASASRHPLGRIGGPHDIASAVCFLLDPQNSWITGQVLHVDGGLDAISGL